MTADCIPSQKGQLEPVGQDRLKKQLELLRAWLPLYIGYAVDIEFVGGEPGGCTHDLFGVEAVGEGDDVVRGCVDRHHVTSANGEEFAGAVGIAGLYGDHVELRYGIGGHWLGRLGDGPGVFGGDVLEVQDMGLTVLGRIAGDGVAFGVQGSGVGDVERLDLKVDGGSLD
jgi:hypothetical protein